MKGVGRGDGGVSNRPIQFERCSQTQYNNDCSNCSPKISKCLLARAPKFFASARMLGFSLKFPAV